MSEFQGDCGHLVLSDGWCEICAEFVHVRTVDGKTAREQDAIDKQEDIEREENGMD